MGNTNETKCLSCDQLRVCILIEASIPVKGEFTMFERLYVCRECLEQHGGVLGSYLTDYLKPRPALRAISRLGPQQPA